MDKTVSLDHGAILSAQNPFATSHRIMVLFGCFGFGTWAAARFLTRPKDWAAAGADSDVLNFEAVVSASIVAGGPQESSVKMFRALTSRVRPESKGWDVEYVRGVGGATPMFRPRRG